MVEANPEDQGWDDAGMDEEGDDWGDWGDDTAAAVAVDLEEPPLGRQGSSFDNAMDIYTTKKRLDISFVSQPEILKILGRRVEQIVDQMGISEDMARALLLKNEWNSDLAIRKFSEDYDYISKTFGFEIGANPVPEGTDDILCPVCFCDYPPNEFIFMPDCGHGLCNYCFPGYLQSKVGDGVESVLSVCPDAKCNMIVPERLFQQLCEPASYNRYKEFLSKSFVDLSKQAKWCPGRDCSMAVEYKAALTVDVTCSSCSKAFCFSCTKDAHMPMSCDGLTTWTDRISAGDDDTANWLKVNTKPCPKCKRPIQKNSGCMHMTCSQCRHEFCWLCMGDYRQHSSETGRGLCNSFEDVKKIGRDTAEMSDVAKIERELKRLEHYQMRYIEHQKSISHAERAQDLIKMQVAQALELNNIYTPNHYQFLIDIAGLVVAARRSLSYTYAIRFYLKGPTKQAFFDLIQGDMERSLEALNKRMEENWLDKLDYDVQGKLQVGKRFIDYKERVQTLRESVERHFNSVMKEISEGLPSIQDDAEDDTDYTFDGTNVGTTWTCRTCQVKNDMKQEKCGTCRSAKPDMSYNGVTGGTGISIGGKKKKGKR